MPCGDAFNKRPELSRKFGPGRDAWGIQHCQRDSAQKKVTSLTPALEAFG
tara:strand:- start:151 stop:300 length:150 start_codon:yes stop_codon:yes gene_type:complete